MGRIDIKADTAKYILVLCNLFEAAEQDDKNSEFGRSIMHEASRFFDEFLPAYMSLIYREESRKILYFYSQTAVERFSNSIQFLNSLLVPLGATW